MAEISLHLTDASGDVVLWRDGELLITGGARALADYFAAGGPLAVAPECEAEPAGWATLSQAWALLRRVYRQDLLRCSDPLPWADTQDGPVEL